LACTYATLPQTISITFHPASEGGDASASSVAACPFASVGDGPIAMMCTKSSVPERLVLKILPELGL